MYFVLFACIIFTTVRHFKKFGQFERAGDHSVFFVNENTAVEVYVNGYPTGIRGSGLLFVDSQLETLEVEFRIGPHWIETRKISLDEPALWILGPVGLPLFPVASAKALV